jgi:hypothetical protein
MIVIIPFTGFFIAIQLHQIAPFVILPRKAVDITLMGSRNSIIVLLAWRWIGQDVDKVRKETHDSSSGSTGGAGSTWKEFIRY